MVALAALAGLAYAAGVRRHPRQWPPRRSVAMAGAVAALAATALAGDATFTAHMVEHLLVGMVAPFLAALAAPVTLALQTAGPATRRLLRRALRSPAGHALAHPVVGFAVFGAGLAGVYLTPLLEWSARNDAVHVAVHAHLLAAGLLFLVPLVGADTLPRPVPFGGRLLAVLLAVPFHAFLGAVLVTAPDPLAPDAYPDLDDQRRAAGLLWGGGELLTVAAAGVVFRRWWRAEGGHRVTVALPSAPVPALSYEDAVAAVTAPGERFETERITVNGVEVTAFTNVPPSLRELFATWRLRPADDVFLVYEDERWTFGDVVGHMDALAAALIERYGVQRGDRVAVGMRNFPEWVIAFAAITSIGAVSVSLNAWWTEDELDFALDDSGAKVLIADVERVERTRAACARLGIATIGVRLGDGAAGAGVDRYGDVVVPGTPMPDVAVDPDDDATILYTSGTTGRPKGAVSTHRAILQALMAFACRTAIARLRHPDDAKLADEQPAVFILVVPLFHVTGSVAVMLSCAAAGLKLVMMHKWDPLKALELIERERVTNFVGVPTQSWDLLEHPRFADFDTSSLVSVGGGGAPAPPALVHRVESSFKRGRPGIGYGMTETNAYGPQNSGEDYVTHPTSAGRWVPILEIEVRDADGRPVPPGARGEIWFKGPHLIRGYWNRPEATAETIVDGWLRSGDIGRIDEEGFLYVEDRAKDMVLRGGENVYCAEVEAAIYEHPAVHEAAVFGVPHERLGEEVAAAVYPKAGATITADELQAHVAARLASFKVPTKVLIVDRQLPRNASGKILKRELRDQLAAG